MNHSIKKFLLTAFVFVIYISGSAQVKIVNVPDAPGKLIREHTTLRFINSFKILPAAKAASLASIADKMMDVICRLPQLNSVQGYNAKVNVATSDLKLKSKEPQLEVYCYLRYLINDSRYAGIKESLDGADLYLYLNDFEFFHQMGNYWKDCSDMNFLLFFEEPALTDSTNDYIEFGYKGDPVRIVMAGSKPLLVPLTRKEFVQFLAARGKFRIKEEEAGIADLQKNKKETQENLAHPVYPLSDEVKKALTGSIGVFDKQIMQTRERIKNIEAQISRYQQYLNAMAPAEAAAPVRLDYSKNGDNIGGMGGLDQLVPVGRKEGKLLVKLNPSFYDHAPGAPAGQMIVIYDAIPMLQYRKRPNYLEQAMLDIFSHLDYHALKMSMQ
jgi:hypothetical protein